MFSRRLKCLYTWYTSLPAPALDPVHEIIKKQTHKNRTPALIVVRTYPCRIVQTLVDLLVSKILELLEYEQVYPAIHICTIVVHLASSCIRDWVVHVQDLTLAFRVGISVGPWLFLFPCVWCHYHHRCHCRPS